MYQSRQSIARSALVFACDGYDYFMYCLLEQKINVITMVSYLEELSSFLPANTDLQTLQRANKKEVKEAQKNSQPPLFTSPYKDSQSYKELQRAFERVIEKYHSKRADTIRKIFNQHLIAWSYRFKSLLPVDWRRWEKQFTRDGQYWIITPHDSAWPRSINELTKLDEEFPPLCIWGEGNPKILTKCDKPLAIVGSRNASESGEATAFTLARECVSRGHVIVSGGAVGIDAAAHWGALSALDSPTKIVDEFGNIQEFDRGGTIAVIAGGLDLRGPRRNEKLFEQILKHGGVLISELPPGTVPEKHRFLERNRIIAALGFCTAIIQARRQSGALNTARWAVEILRTVYAVPGDINSPTNIGCNNLLMEHRAELLCDASNIDQFELDNHAKNKESSNNSELAQTKLLCSG